MKAILVIDVDDDMIGEVDYTVLSKSEMVNGRTKLRPLPEKLYVEANQIEDLMPSEFDMDKLILKIQLDADKLCALGWNACLKEITGEID